MRTLRMYYIRGPLPDNMGCMVNLTELEMHNSELPDLPDSLGELRSLQMLSVSSCGLKALPASVANLSRLQRLSVDGNKLRSCPPLGTLRKLIVVDLSDNYLASIPEGLSNLPLLMWVKIYRNCMYTLEWNVLKRLPLLGSKYPMPDMYDPSEWWFELRMRARNGVGYETPTVV